MFSKLIPLAETNLPPLQCALTAGRLLHSDSRKIRAGDVFIACQGEFADGRQFIPAAIANGASFVFWDDDGQFQWNESWQVPNQGIRDLKTRAGVLAAQVYRNAKDAAANLATLPVWGVTGTNGKTSITQWLAQAADLLGEKTAIIGTVGNGFWGELEETTHTTPDPVAVQTLLHRFTQAGATAAAMEVSSHGLAQFRVNGVAFRSAIFTNLTRDHLDYHGTMDEYGAMKARLFFWQGLQHAIVNADDAFGRDLIQQLQTAQDAPQVLSYGFHAGADIHITNFAASSRGMNLRLHTPWGDGEVSTRLLGRFNAQNFAACVALLCANGYELNAVLNALAQIRPATGRMDCLMNEGKPLVVVDYAHTPDALEKALATLQEIKANDANVWCVFGCGGNRDKGKRPLMGEAAVNGADKVVVTSDNPRLENPADIIADILPAVPSAEYVNENRAAAIEYAIAHAGADDIVLIAGKGHETYQDIQGTKHYFSDFDVAQNALAGK
ncbi:MAG: UDP-N-acetylmuramoyl-L-alanyl-D-glutamate--2,6-diaminopimelate ligase [Neisseria sp.]|nr:UDP-N-acetylmuramoyl-L-alanyl-D-glutamate--2,6-diaminopimelate ligase [Neisseria sp.]